MSWNIQGQSFRFGPTTNISKVLPYLSKNKTDIFCLQEAPMPKWAKHFIGYENFLPGLSAKVTEGYERNDNIILSRFGFVERREIFFPRNLLGPDCQAEPVSYAKINVKQTNIHIYNCHFPITGAGPKTRYNLMNYLCEQAAETNEPVVFCGDLNITILKPGLLRKIIQLWHQEPNSELQINNSFLQEDERIIFSQLVKTFGFKDVFNLNTPTWSPVYSRKWEMFQLKLDWLLYKNLEIVEAKMGPYISDHRPLIMKARI